MIFLPDSGQHTRGETRNLIRTHHRATEFLLDTNKHFEKRTIRRNSLRTNNGANFYSIQKRNSTRYKLTPRLSQSSAIRPSTCKPADAIFNRQPRRLETNVTHTKQTTATLLHRQFSRSFVRANLTPLHLPSDLIFDHRNPRA